jgi:hypothetical protein
MLEPFMPKVALRDIEKDIEKALRKQFGSFGLDHVELKAGLDHDGDPAVFVTAILPPQAPPMPGEISGAANVVVAQVLHNAGDDRLSYLHIHHPDDELPLEEPRGVPSSS